MPKSGNPWKKFSTKYNRLLTFKIKYKKQKVFKSIMGRKIKEKKLKKRIINIFSRNIS